jgi:TonB family protein
MATTTNRKEMSMNGNRNRPLIRRAAAIVLGAGIALALAYAQDHKPVRIGGNVQAYNRISSVAPVYPAEAKRDGIQGTVKLEVLITKDGHVSDITVISGPAELTQSSIDAVRQWIYKPTLLNNEPVEVLTTIDVNYTLSQ